jgi:hypothetical protein
MNRKTYLEQRMVFERKEIVIQCLMSDFSKTNKVKLRSEATSLFDVQRWMFDVRCSVCSMLDVHLLIFEK